MFFEALFNSIHHLNCGERFLAHLHIVFAFLNGFKPPYDLLFVSYNQLHSLWLYGFPLGGEFSGSLLLQLSFGNYKSMRGFVDFGAGALYLAKCAFEFQLRTFLVEAAFAFLRRDFHLHVGTGLGSLAFFSSLFFGCVRID